MIQNCVDDIDIWIPWDCSWAWYDNTFNYFFSFQEHFYDSASSTGYITCRQQSRGRFVENLQCHQISLFAFLQEAQISEELFMLKGSLMVKPAKMPRLCSTIPQTIRLFSRRWERPFSTVRSLLMTQAEVLISSPASQDSWIQKDW